MIAYSFSLSGSKPQYTSGVQKNIDALDRLFPGCTMLVYCPDDIEQYVSDKRSIIVERVPVEPSKDLACHLWRIQAVCRREFTHVCVRDIDSIVSDREAAAVRQWLDSDFGYHCMRDHHWHTMHGDVKNPIQGGLWGAMPSRVPDRFEYLLTWWLARKRPFARSADCWFLNRFIRPLMLRDGLEHDGCGSHWGGVPFPTPRVGNEYVGEYA